MRPMLKVVTLCAMAVLSASSLSGCGYAPLYARSDVTAGLGSIAIDAPQTRTGYFLEQDLRNGFGSDEDSQKLYKLTITMKEQHYSVGIRVDDTSTRSEITNNIAYTLTNVQTGKVIYKDHFTDTVTYDTSVSPFTGIVSQQDGQVRIATSISRKIQTGLALYFHDKH